MDQEKQSPLKQKHTLALVERKKCIITGVADISAFNEEEIVLKTEDYVLIVDGEDLHIGSVHIEEGKLDICGTINSVSYVSPRLKIHSLFGKMKK